MSVRALSSFRILGAAAASLLLVSCGESGPKPPQPGSAAFNWNAAKAAYAAGDYAKAQDLFLRLTKSDEYKAQARPAAITLSAALASAYGELAEKFEEGAKKTRGNQLPFRRHAGAYKAKAVTAGKQYLEISRGFAEVSKAQEVPMVLEIPKNASLEHPGQYQKLSTGAIIPDAEVATVEGQVIQHDLSEDLSAMLGAPKDLDKARAAYQNGEAKIPGPAYMMSQARALNQIAEMFGPKKLNQSNVMIKAAYDEAETALALVKDGGKEAKDLTKKIADAKKKLKVD
jgi:tetratricopeptide (TPR) repeat protein